MLKKIYTIGLIMVSTLTIFSCTSKTESTNNSQTTNTTINETATTVEVQKTEENTTAEPKELTLGEIKDYVYTNDYFDFKITLPADWYDLSEEQQNAMLEAGKEIIAQGDESKSKRADLAMQNTLSFFTLYEMNPLEATNYNPSMAMIAEKISTIGNVFVTTGKDYLEVVKAQLSEVTETEGMSLEYNFNDIENMTLGNKDFDVMNIETNINDGMFLIHQDYYATKVDDYVLSIIVSYSSEEQKSTIDNSLQTITFNQ